MKKFLKLALVAVSCAGMLALTPTADATCGVDVSFGNYPSVGTCPNGFCYVQSPGQQTVASFVGSSWWGLGIGDPAVGAGNDNGDYGADAWMIGPYTNGFNVTGGTDRGSTDGCPTPNDMILALSNTDAGGTTAYYALSAALRDGARASEYDFGAGGQDLAMVELPALTVTGSTRNADDSINVTVSWTPNGAAAFYPNDTTVTLGQVVTGWDIYKFEILGDDARAGVVPTDRNTANWSRVGGAVGNDASTATVTVACDATANNAFLAIVPALDSGFTTAYVGSNSTRIECDPNLADPGDRQFKLIDRGTGDRIKPKKNER